MVPNRRRKKRERRSKIRLKKMHFIAFFYFFNSNIKLPVIPNPYIKLINDTNPPTIGINLNTKNINNPIITSK